jgi:hypothetical protein
LELVVLDHQAEMMALVAYLVEMDQTQYLILLLHLAAVELETFLTLLVALVDQVVAVDPIRELAAPEHQDKETTAVAVQLTILAAVAAVAVVVPVRLVVMP